MTPHRYRSRSVQAGLSYLEVLIATLILTISLAPLLRAVQANNSAAGVDAILVAQRNHATNVLERTLSLPLATLNDEALITGSSSIASARYSDAPGSSPRAQVYLAPYDGDNADGDNDPFTGADLNLLWVRVVIDDSNIELSALVAQ